MLADAVMLFVDTVIAIRSTSRYPLAAVTMVGEAV
jgi:hypothetical protein